MNDFGACYSRMKIERKNALLFNQTSKQQRDFMLARTLLFSVATYFVYLTMDFLRGVRDPAKSGPDYYVPVTFSSPTHDTLA